LKQKNYNSSPPQSRPRSAWIPRWHYDMINDASRNDAYERAVRKAVAHTRAAGVTEVRSEAAGGVAYIGPQIARLSPAKAGFAAGQSSFTAVPRPAAQLLTLCAARQVMVLDIGAGSGLLGMLAARAGADKVVGIEQSLHMCEVGEECEVMNGFLPKCMMLQRYVNPQRLDRGRSRHGSRSAEKG
jgi:2-polyprenyl-3-methyl-5-hydroxy-6-metoxy-1,4-benzoquinol methylase